MKLSLAFVSLAGIAFLSAAGIRGEGDVSKLPQPAPQTVDSRTNHWAFTKPLRPEVPGVQHKSWPRNPIDHFILAKLEAKKLEPSPESDRVVLLRRLKFDLLGLPP